MVGRSRNSELMASDVLYGLNDIFCFFMRSEAHVLSFLASQIDKNSSLQGDDSGVADAESLSNLLNCQKFLEGQIEEIQHVHDILSRRTACGWPRSDSDVTQDTAQRLEQDTEYLMKKAHTLKKRVEVSIALFMNVASIGEARRGVSQNKALFRFTVLAAVYVPLSFSASIFGMNFTEFGTGSLSLWVYFAISAPIFAISALYLFGNTWVSFLRSKGSPNQ